MTTIRHLNCGWLVAPGGLRAACHCLLLEDRHGLALIDTGIGLADVRNPDRLGRELIEQAGFQLDEADTAIRQIQNLGFREEDIQHVILTHADPDHTGGLFDFAAASVHISQEELAAVAAGSWRYVPAHFEHNPLWVPYAETTDDWFGLPARRLPLEFETEILLIPLFGHTRGHCGVAINQESGWLLHAGDAYYLRGELTEENHPVSELAELRAEDNAARLRNLEELRRLLRDHGDEIEMFGYHDPSEVILT